MDQAAHAKVRSGSKASLTASKCDFCHNFESRLDSDILDEGIATAILTMFECWNGRRTQWVWTMNIMAAQSDVTSSTAVKPFPAYSQESPAGGNGPVTSHHGNDDDQSEQSGSKY